MTTADILDRLFAGIDDYPNTSWLVRVLFPLREDESDLPLVSEPSGGAAGRLARASGRAQRADRTDLVGRHDVYAVAAARVRRPGGALPASSRRPGRNHRHQAHVRARFGRARAVGGPQ